MWIARENSNLIGPIYKYNEVLAAIWHFFSFGEQKVGGLTVLQRGKGLQRGDVLGTILRVGASELVKKEREPNS